MSKENVASVDETQEPTLEALERMEVDGLTEYQIAQTLEYLTQNLEL